MSEFAQRTQELLDAADEVMFHGQVVEPGSTWNAERDISVRKWDLRNGTQEWFRFDVDVRKFDYVNSLIVCGSIPTVLSISGMMAAEPEAFGAVAGDCWLEFRRDGRSLFAALFYLRDKILDSCVVKLSFASQGAWKLPDVDCLEANHYVVG